MDNSKEFQFMLDKAIESEPSDFKNFDRTRNLQDQLQEMIKHRESTTLAIWFADFCNINEYLEGFDWDGKTKYLNQFISMEQLWLAFVMKEKFNKVWNGENWIKES